MIEYRKPLDEYVRDCKDPKKKAAAISAKKTLEVYRKYKREAKAARITPLKTYKGEVLANPDGMKLEAGKIYKAELIDDEDVLEALKELKSLGSEDRDGSPVMIETATVNPIQSERIKNIGRELEKLRVLAQVKPLTDEQRRRRAELVLMLDARQNH